MLIERELVVIVLAYLLAGIPVGGVAVIGRVSPMYQVESAHLFRWWSRFALAIVLLGLALASLG